MRKPKQFYVYIMTNRSGSHVLYTGVTGNLERRVFEHKGKLVSGFTTRYNLTRLAYIESTNPHWDDLAERWMEVYRPDGAARKIPRPAGENARLRDDAF